MNNEYYFLLQKIHYTSDMLLEKIHIHYTTQYISAFVFSCRPKTKKEYTP